ncbi:MAG: hypothetical protein ACI8ZO_001268, partial [Flavobacteriales bacterium]
KVEMMLDRWLNMINPHRGCHLPGSIDSKTR